MTAAPEVIRAAGVVLTRGAGAELEVAVIHRRRRRDWSLPKGKLQPDEDAQVAAVREVEEETGLVLDPAELHPVAYERFARETHTHSHQGRWVPGRDILQVYATRTQVLAPPIRPEQPGETPPRWVDDAELTRCCEGSFWWPLALHILGLSAHPR